MKTNIMKKSAALLLLLGAFVSPLIAKEKKVTPKTYPLNVCIVSSEELGDMGDPLYLLYQGQLYGFCCKPCTEDFRENPEKFRKKLEKIQKAKSK